ncbi:hypothetical protein L1987_18112 [Smallanthus sonchifolius]|uniref:Uncharacterized protein n=1 Tax=Smallanthus sonchifolius TaxID=185202 RepID=A0ACB9IZE4_9ASTR|nr:hypothetical protein L1987_18112 [Smallanthus sonchifolius]
MKALKIVKPSASHLRFSLSSPIHMPLGFSDSYAFRVPTSFSLHSISFRASSSRFVVYGMSIRSGNNVNIPTEDNLDSNVVKVAIKQMLDKRSQHNNSSLSTSKTEVFVPDVSTSGDSSARSSRLGRTRTEPVVRSRTDSRVAIFRDREVERKDPDYGQVMLIGGKAEKVCWLVLVV